MKSLIVTILSSIVFLVSFQGAGTMLQYELNKAYYEAQCVNKERPEMECHGHCKLREDAEKESSQPDLAHVSIDFNLLPQHLIVLKSVEEAPSTEDRQSAIYEDYAARIIKGYYAVSTPPPVVA